MRRQSPRGSKLGRMRSTADLSAPTSRELCGLNQSWCFLQMGSLVELENVFFLYETISSHNVLIIFLSFPLFVGAWCRNPSLLQTVHRSFTSRTSLDFQVYRLHICVFVYSNFVSKSHRNGSWTTNPFTWHIQGTLVIHIKRILRWVFPTSTHSWRPHFDWDDSPRMVSNSVYLKLETILCTLMKIIRF